MGRRVITLFWLWFIYILILFIAALWTTFKNVPPKCSPQITLKGPEEEEVSEACKIPQFREESGS